MARWLGSAESCEQIEFLRRLISESDFPMGEYEGGTIKFEFVYTAETSVDFQTLFLDAIDRRPSLVWSQFEGAYELLTYANSRHIRTMLYLMDAEFNRAKVKSLTEQGTIVICCSKFLQRILAVIDVPSTVVYPIADEIVRRFQMLKANIGGPIIMLNTFPQKGIVVFLEIARCLPDRKFVLVESWPMNEPHLEQLCGHLSTLPNIEFLRRQTDITHVLGGASLLLVPSRYQEGFGLVAIEANAAGVPVIASRRGGLPESVGDGGILIDEYLNVEHWVGVIQEMLQDPSRFEQLSIQSRRSAARQDFNSHNVLKIFQALAFGNSSTIK